MPDALVILVDSLNVYMFSFLVGLICLLNVLHYIHQNDYVNIAIIGSCRLGNGQGRYSLEGHGAPPTTGRHSRILLLMGTHIYWSYIL